MDGNGTASMSIGSGRMALRGDETAGPVLELFGRIAQVLAAKAGQADVLHDVLEILEVACGFRHSTIMLVSQDGSELVVEALRGRDRRSRTDVRYRRGEGVTGSVLESGEAIAVADVAADERFCDRVHRRSERGETPCGFVCVPVKVDGELAGTLAVDVPEPVDGEVERALGLMAVVASMIGHDVQLRREANHVNGALKEENLRLRQALGEKMRPDDILGESAAMREVYLRVNQVSGSETTVLLRGEVGSGKEMVARAIHHGSRRREKPFVRINCATLGDGLLEGEIFGHERGPLTGAKYSRTGRLEDAEGGTVFFDEVGEFDQALQVKLLRLLQDGTYQRVGSSVERKADVRIIAATAAPLETLLEEQRIRLDLYYRLNVFQVHVPSLRERRTDILLLANHFAKMHGRNMGKAIERISTSAIGMLQAYHWPGNVRELKSCMEYAVMVTQDGIIQSHNLPLTLQMPNQHPSSLGAGSLPATVEAIERDMCMDALKHTNGNVAAAARELGVTPRILRYKIKKLGLEYQKVFGA